MNPARPRRRPVVHDVLGLGCCAVDDLLYTPAYPAADSKVEIRGRERQCGGLTGTALVAAARLGGRCAYAGTLDDGIDSDLVRATLTAEGIDLSLARRHRDATPVRSVIVVDEVHGTRNIFFTTAPRHGAAARHPEAAVIESAGALLVDRFGMPGMIRAARIARAAGVPVVSDLENKTAPRSQELLNLTDHLVVSAGFARELSGARTAPDAARRLWRRDRAAVVVTEGPRCWALTGDPRQVEVSPVPVLPVEAVDTTGCGDVFHGAYALGLAWSWPIADCLLLAAATAAIKATRRGGQAGIPDLPTVRRRLKAAGMHLPAAPR